MRLRSMEMTDFGPYRGVQTFDFSQQPGVELLWGENGRGKTSFLNALRWALFEVVLGRNSARVDPSQVGNREDGDTAAAVPFKVVLTFEHDGHEYRLTRAYADDDVRGGYKTVASLVRDGDVLGPDERDRSIAQLLPEQIARFFLFDAELLQEYEQLLTAGSDAGEKLKEAIERVLGLPVLTQARDDVATLLAAARTAQAKAAQNDKTTKALGQQLQLASDELEQAGVNVQELVTLLDETQNAVNEIERNLTANHRFRGIIATRDAKAKEVKGLEARVQERTEDLTSNAAGLWRAVLGPVITSQLEVIQDREDQLSDQVTQNLTHGFAAQAVRDHNCPICHQSVSEEAAAALHPAEQGPESVEEMNAERAALRTRRDTLRRVRGDAQVLLQVERELLQARVDLSDAQGQLSTFESQLAEAPSGTAETVAQLVEELKQTNVLLSNTRERLRDAREDHQRKEQAVSTLSEKLRKVGAPGTGEADRKVSLLVDLHALLVAAVGDFRDRLRDQVEDQASQVFKALTAESDYDRLRINDNYGLTILHADGSEVLNRSSGYEHVVALSLIAALQRCSPMSGPIITDSPFGRLDRTHKEHVLKALPHITDQVLLLVHDDELDRGVALNVLGTDLSAEHHLRRATPRHTEIEEGPHP